MIKKQFLKTLIIASVYSLTGAFFISHAAEEGKELQADSKPAPRIVRSGDLQRHSVGIGLGQTFLHGDFNDTGTNQITVDLYYNYTVSHSFDFMLNFHSSSHDLKGFKTSISGAAISIKAKAYQIDNFSPFFLAGLGFYSPVMKREVEGVTKDSEDNLVFGYNVGLGGELKLNDRVTVGLLGHYHNPFDVPQDSGDPDVEGHYFKLLITAFYTF